MSNKRIAVAFGIFVLVVIFAFTLPVRCTSVIVNPGLDEGDVRISSFKSQTCTSIYRKEFWMNYDLLSRNVEFIFGVPVLTGWWGAGTYRQFSGDVHQVIIHHLYPADFSDNKILMGSSHNVFVGKVIAQVGNQDFVGNPATQFSVEVVENIKGNMKGTVTINQEGGLRDGVLYLAEENGKMMEVGLTYLLATRYDSENDYYTLNSHENASKLLSTDRTKNNVILKEFAGADEKVKFLLVAYPNEVLLDADIANNNTRNAFQSLPPEAKAAAVARADAARASLGVNAE